MTNLESKSDLFYLNEDDTKYVKDTLKEVNREESIEKIKIWINQSNDFQAPTGKYYVISYLISIFIFYDK